MVLWVKITKSTLYFFFHLHYRMHAVLQFALQGDNNVPAALPYVARYMAQYRDHTTAYPSAMIRNTVGLLGRP
jgi:hypothetical protein